MHATKKAVPKEQSAALFFLEKSKTARRLFDHVFCLHWRLSYCCCSKIFYIQKFSQFDEFVLDFALHRRLTTESRNTCSSPGNLETFANQKNWKFAKNKENPAKLCKSFERNLINIKATDKIPSLNNFVIIF